MDLKDFLASTDTEGNLVAPGAVPPTRLPERVSEAPAMQATQTVETAPAARRAPSLSEFLGSYEPPPEPVEERSRTGFEAVKDTGSQLAEGVNTILGAVPNLIAPEGRVAEFFNSGAEYWRNMQSDPLKARMSAASQKIDEAGKEGVAAQMAEAARQYIGDPALAARFVATNLPSMIPGIAAAKVAQAAALAKGATAIRAGQVATGAAAGANAALNAGGARGESFADIRDTLIKQGVSPEDATELALKDSRVVAAIGGLAGALSGATGLEKTLVTGATRAGAQRAGVAGLKSAAAELAGEQVEEVAPKVMTNVQAGQYDSRSPMQDVGRTIVETAIGSAPGAAVGGVTAGFDQARKNTNPTPIPEPTPKPDPVSDPIREIVGATSIDQAITAATSGLDLAMADAGMKRAARQAEITRQSEIEMMQTTANERAAIAQKEADTRAQAELDLEDLIGRETRDINVRRGLAVMGQREQRQKEAESDLIVQQSRTALGAQPEQQMAVGKAASELGQPTAMQVAMERARLKLDSKKQDGDWQAFDKETGTRGVPRAEMPQIKAEHRGAMVNFLNARGVAHQEEMVEPSELKPTQAEYSPAKIKQALEYEGGNRAILVSEDGHVLDGHHQWMAAQQTGTPVRVIRLGAPIDRLMKLAHEFPSSTKDKSTEAPANVQNPAPTSIDTKTGTAPAEAGTPVASAATTTETVPGAGSAAVEPDGVEPAERDFAARYGRDGQALAEGGKPFRHNWQAKAARQLQPNMKIARVEGGWALREKSDAELAAEAKNIGNIRSAKTSPKGEPIAAHAFIAAEGGIEKTQTNEFRFGKNPQVGNRKLFSPRGMTLEQVTEKLVESGYLKEGASHTDAIALIRKSMTTPQYTPEGFEWQAEKEMAERAEAAQNTEPEPDEAPANDAEAEFYALDTPDLDTLPADAFDALDALIPEFDAPENMTMAAAMQALGFTQQEIEDAQAKTDTRAKEGGAGVRQETDEGTGQAPTRSSEGSSRTGRIEPTNSLSRTASWVIKNKETGDIVMETFDKKVVDALNTKKYEAVPILEHLQSLNDTGLTSPTEQEVLDQQERRTAGDKAEATRRTEEEQRARADAERGDFTLTGSNRTSDSNPGQKPMFSRAPNRVDQTETPAFKEWFGDSKVVDAEGKPLVVYHGGDPDSQISSFKPSATGAIWFTDNREYAEFTSHDKFERGESKVYDAYISIKNPLDLREQAGNQWDAIRDDQDVIKNAKAAGYDGIILNDRNSGVDGISYVAFSPEQIKSATGNQGTFDKTNPDIRFSRTSQAPLQALSETDDLFQLPKSEAKTIRDLAENLMPGTKVSVTKLGLETMYTLRLPSGATARITEREPNPYGGNADQVYGFDVENGEAIDVITERPGKNAESIPNDTKDVWIDVSNLKTGQEGAKVYNLAANYAFNNGAIFIGDPSGLSDIAMRRRTEHMLSSALKFGTTKHLAPHPRQLEGDSKTGVPPLDWTYGDDLANIRSLLKVSLESFKHAGPNPITFNADTGRYSDSQGRELDERAIRSVAETGPHRASNAGSSTLKRMAIFESLIRGEGPAAQRADGKRRGVLAALVALQREQPLSTEGTFYSRQPEAERQGVAPKKLESMVARMQRDWANAPETIIAARQDDLPKEILDQFDPVDDDDRLEGIFHNGKVYLVAENLPDMTRAQAVWAHEILGHYGLRGIFQDRESLDTALENLWRENASIQLTTARKIREYGYDKPTAIEEAISDLAADYKPIKGINRFMRAIQTALRAIGMDALADYIGERQGGDKLASARGDLTEGLRQVLDATRAYVRRGSRAPSTTFAPAIAMASLATPTISRAGREFIRNSKVKKVVYHATDADFNIFDTSRSDLGAHFGTVEQANRIADSRLGMRGRGEAQVMPVLLNLENPLRLKDVGTFHADGISIQLEKKGILPKGEGKRIEKAIDADWRQRKVFDPIVRDAIKAAGYDGIVYANTQEGTGDSYIAFEPNQIKSVIGNSGDFDHSNPDIRFSRKSLITGQPLPQTWQAPDASRMDDFIYSMQDKHVDTKRVVTAVRDAIGALSDTQDPYLQEELYHGRASKATKDFLETGIRPLLTDLKARGVDISDFEEYLHNRHAERRNVQVAKVNPDMQDGGSGIATADARAYLAGLPADKHRAYEALAKRVDKINRETRDLLVSSGLEKQETIDAWDAAYGDEYVPLMREEMEGGAQGIGQGFSVKGGASKRAMGSNKPVADILANIALQREKAITRAEKRRIGEALYGMVLSAPNPDFWFAVDPELQKDPAKITATALQLINMGMNPADAESIAAEPTQRYIDPRTNQVAERINPALRNADNVLAVRIDGEDKFVFFNAKDERAMRMVKSLKNLDADQLGEVMGTVSKMTRYFSAINTQYNPIFGVVNVTRDVQAALLNLQSTPLKGKQAEVSKLVMPALRGIYIDLRDRRAGKQPTSAYAQLFEEFQKEGGATGYRNMYANAKERAEAIVEELEGLKDGTVKKAGKGIMGWLSDYNESMENAVRLAAYKVGKDSGLSNQQAASIAKNLTTNFNRKGQVALQAGALWAFFNASIQGTARIGQTMFENGRLTGIGKQILTGGMMLGSMQALLLAAAGFDDEEPPDFVRERSLVIPIGDKKYISIPMPLGFHVLPSLSRIPTEWAMGGFKDTPKRIGQMVGLFADAFNPIGSAGLSLQTLTPTIIDPLAALTENKDFTGKSIAKQDFNSMQPTAGHTRAKDTATPWAKAISYGVNWLTGGTDFKPGLASPTPDQIDYLIGQVTGGVGREASKLAQVGESAVTGEELPLFKIPLVGRFIGTTEGQAAESAKFYANLKKLGEHDSELTGLKGEGNAEAYAEYLADNPEAILVKQADRTYRDVRNLVKAKREAAAAGGSRARVKLLEQNITARMKAFNDQLRLIEERDTETQ